MVAEDAWSLKDWGTVVGMVKDGALVAFGLSGAFVAWKGLNTWRRQLKGTDKYKLALRAMRAVYEVRDQVVSCKARGWWSHEADDRERGETESEEERRHLDLLHLYTKRLDKLVAAMSDLETIRLELLPVFGGGSEEVVLKFREVVRSVQADATAYFMLPWYERNTKDGLECHNKVFGDPPPELNLALEAAARYFRPYIK